jgi:hypothetical protein
MQYTFKFETICYGARCIFGYPTRGIVNVLSSFGHEQYPSNNINAWCLITKYPIEGIAFFVGFGRVT